ncbi:MAG: hypothetical protein DUD39_10580 [Coriobacteriaceae bacterium]|nr:MAG: hypothetical protein DUD39_10580 [Coriobacteriaceae bacterium]
MPQQALSGSICFGRLESGPVRELAEHREGPAPTARHSQWHLFPNHMDFSGSKASGRHPDACGAGAFPAVRKPARPLFRLACMGISVPRCQGRTPAYLRDAASFKLPRQAAS